MTPFFLLKANPKSPTEYGGEDEKGEEGNTMFDADTLSFYLDDEASVKKKESEVTKDLFVEMDTNDAQTKNLSQLTADNAKWEDP
ncbi:hypothetical protein L1887_34681 [Cichorium endivia]|nr:hypothetical protein L1887_34681 [Cichorium endivia]